MGRVSGEVTAAGKTFNQSTNGFGDPMIEFNMNVLGPQAQKSIPDALRYGRDSLLTCSPTWHSRLVSTIAVSP